MARKGSRKQIAQDRRDAWRKAVTEGRVVMTSESGRTYHTAAEAQDALVLLVALGFTAWIPKEEEE